MSKITTDYASPTKFKKAKVECVFL